MYCNSVVEGCPCYIQLILSGEGMIYFRGDVFDIGFSLCHIFGVGGGNHFIGGLVACY